MSNLRYLTMNDNISTFNEITESHGSKKTIKCIFEMYYFSNVSKFLEAMFQLNKVKLLKFEIENWLKQFCSTSKIAMQFVFF